MTEHYSLPQTSGVSVSFFHSFFLCFFLLTNSSEQFLNVTVVYVKATHTQLPCCLFLANGKPGGFLVRQNLHFNQASGQSSFCCLINLSSDNFSNQIFLSIFKYESGHFPSLTLCLLEANDIPLRLIRLNQCTNKTSFSCRAIAKMIW